MWPRTRNGEKKHRQRKRILEIKIIVDSIRRLPRGDSKFNVKTKILEFGAGEGFQVPYLQDLGQVIVSDIYMSENMKAHYQSSFVKCSICATPFDSNTFDLIFSNHVIVYIEDLNRAFDEMKRIGKVDCIYAFSVPTEWWVVLSIPAHYYNVFMSVLRKIFRRPISNAACSTNALEKQKFDVNTNNRRNKKQSIVKILNFILPSGLGCYPSFCKAFWCFRVKAWRTLFEVNGFRILRIEPLLLYAPSEWPIVPTMRLPARYGWCSSVLFLMKRAIERKEVGKL